MGPRSGAVKKSPLLLRLRVVRASTVVSFLVRARWEESIVGLYESHGSVAAVRLICHVAVIPQARILGQLSPKKANLFR